MADVPQVCDHLHLPVQSGSDDVLRRMRRGYTRDHYLGKIAALRELVPGMTFSTDIIVGFPGETEPEFERTLSLLREVEYDQVYSFTYSPRPHTVAQRSLPDDVPHGVKVRRLMALQAMQSEIQARRNRAYVGRDVEILVEGPNRRRAGELVGRTTQNRVVNVPAADLEPGRFVRVRVTGAGPNHLKGLPAGGEATAAS